jgi:hypothetical protein
MQRTLNLSFAFALACLCGFGSAHAQKSRRPVGKVRPTTAQPQRFLTVGQQYHFDFNKPLHAQGGQQHDSHDYVPARMSRALERLAAVNGKLTDQDGKSLHGDFKLATHAQLEVILRVENGRGRIMMVEPLGAKSFSDAKQGKDKRIDVARATVEAARANRDARRGVGKLVATAQVFLASRKLGEVARKDAYRQATAVLGSYYASAKAETASRFDVLENLHSRTGLLHVGLSPAAVKQLLTTATDTLEQLLARPQTSRSFLERLSVPIK